jgi:hypothetical protein
MLDTVASQVGRPVIDFDESIRMALLVSALCNNSGVTQKERERDDAVVARKLNKDWMWWGHDKDDESVEKANILSRHEDGT